MDPTSLTWLSALLVAALAFHSTRVAPYRPVLRRRKVLVPSNWPAVEILHLSDLHLRRSDPKLLEGQVKALAGLPRQPDLVCVTGDLCEKLADAPLVMELLSGLRPKLGMYLIPGNHEYGAGSPKRLAQRGGIVARVMQTLYGPALSSGPQEGDAIVTALLERGLHVLRNAGVRVESGDDSIWLAGIDSGWTGRADFAPALLGRGTDEGMLVMVHEPELAFPAIGHGADLVLAGHTHGGQVRLPFLGPLYWHRSDPRLKVAAGLQSIAQAQLHISAGTGQLMPLRLCCPTELVWLSCVPSATTEPQQVDSRVLVSVE